MFQCFAARVGPASECKLVSIVIITDIPGTTRPCNVGGRS